LRYAKMSKKQREPLVKAIVADAGLLMPEAGVVGLDKFDVDLWIAHDGNALEHEAARAMGGPVCTSRSRSGDVAAALRWYEIKDPHLDKGDILFLQRRVNFIGRFTAGAGTTCGEWTFPVNGKGQKGFWKANPATGWCPARCDFCYLLGLPFAVQSLALNVGEYATQVARRRVVRNRKIVPPVINLGETGGLLEWAAEYNAPEIVQAYIDASLDAGVTPYILTKRAIRGLGLAGAHVGISLNPKRVMNARSPEASSPDELLMFLANAKQQGASTVIRWGPMDVYLGSDSDYGDLAGKVYGWGLADGRITVDLFRFSKNHPARMRGFEFRAHKWQEMAETQRLQLQTVRDLFPNARITGCKLDPGPALEWVREGIIRAMPCACWI
jgi:DNA repair photolyase